MSRWCWPTDKMMETLLSLCGCWCTGRAWRLTLKANAGARGTQDLRRCFRPPINDEAPPSSFHTKTDGLQEKEHVSHWQRRLQFLDYSYGVTCVGDYRSPKGMTSSLIKNSMVSSSQSSTLLSSSSVSTPGGHIAILARSPHKEGSGKGSAQSHLLWVTAGCSSVPGRPCSLPPCSGGNLPSWPCACPPAPTPQQTQAHLRLKHTAKKKQTRPKLSEILNIPFSSAQNWLLKINTGQTLEALDWLRRSFCSKILEYFLRSFLIIWKRWEGLLAMKECSSSMILFL